MTQVKGQHLHNLFNDSSLWCYKLTDNINNLTIEKCFLCDFHIGNEVCELCRKNIYPANAGYSFFSKSYMYFFLMIFKIIEGYNVHKIFPFLNFHLIFCPLLFSDVKLQRYRHCARAVCQSVCPASGRLGVRITVIMKNAFFLR